MQMEQVETTMFNIQMAAYQKIVKLILMEYMKEQDQERRSTTEFALCNEGGQQQNQKKFNFLLNLRSYNKIAEEPLQKDFLRRTFYTTKRQILKSRQLQSSQRQLTLKLSSPKSIK
ncbi:unnamed protein product [Paramecium sonneborni]|uniref:Uncharacterized protein n=1 Tax=Paramecium sonneborni TaxID=65129 RepID=A0A8S1LQH4_9CILI|nr:unnamed protein product [Paramecium sonneborni]